MRREPPTAFRRLRLGWAAALGVLGAAGALIAAGVWFLRVPLAELTLRSALSDRGVEADFQILNLDFGRATLANVRLGSETSPDAQASLVEAVFGWEGLGPQLRAVHIVEPRLRLTMDTGGRVTAGALDKLGGDGRGGGRFRVPAIRLDIENGQALITAPFGAITAEFHSSGTLGRDFSALAEIPATTREGEDYALDQGLAELVVVSEDDQLAFRLTAAAQALTWAGAETRGVGLMASGRAPLDLSRAEAETTWRVATLAHNDISAANFTGRIAAAALMRDDALAPATWRGEAALASTRLAFNDAALSGARLRASIDGEMDHGAGEWGLVGERFAGFQLTSLAPSADGRFAFNLRGEEELTLDAALTLAQARLDESAQADMRNALPNAEGAPIGPTFAQAERALDAAFDRFTLTAPLQLRWRGDVGRLVSTAPIDVRAASGALMRLAPLREDTPVLAMQWPGSTFHAASAAELSGGGLPRATLLLDALDWAPEAPLEAVGTLTLANWSAENARFSTEDLELTLTAPPEGEARLDIAGAARMTGPLGDGEVRDLLIDLNLTAMWGNGWRITPKDGCLPVRLSGLDVAGLAFQGGAFALCAGDGGALIAADASDQLSGGFVIQALRLDGRMAGPDAQPAHLRSQNVNGRFSGQTDNILLTIQAAAPSLAIDMAEDRTLAITGERLTAEARVMNDTWRVDGAFEAGALADPTLPGDVSAIAGKWSMAPEDERTIIRVSAGEARLVARTPPEDAEETRPLFSPLRLANVGAELSEGQITAQGDIVLEAGARQLAHFTAEHDVEAGVGAAHVTAELVFNEGLQPYEMSELARGLVENVRGPASLAAEIAWTGDTLTATGHVRPQGVSLAMATIPVIENVRGDIYFDDLFTLTTPPGQVITVGLINPGVPVGDGRLQFQLLPEERVAIERADFAFAAGVLSVEPTTITLGAERTEFNLLLRDVDVAALVTQLNMPDLRATGRVEGRFPLLLTRETGYIQNGVLRAAPGGGVISYVGSAGDGATGPARVAFEALRSFHYDDLSLTLNGDISGNVITTVNFSGENTGRAVDLTEVARLPGVGAVSARGVPFRFRVSVTAPFAQLAQTAAGVVDARAALERAVEEQERREAEESTPPSVDVQVEPLR